MIYCAQCGKANEDNVNFCTSCGADLTKNSPATQQPTSKGAGFGTGAIGGVLLIIGFFMPWVSFGYSMSVNAYDVVFGPMGREADAPASRYLLVLLPIAGIIFLIHALINKMDKGFINAIKYVPIILIVGFIIYIMYKVNENGGRHSFSSRDFSDLLHGMGFGVWCTIAGAVTMCFHKEK